jgi:hypothetical protein
VAYNVADDAGYCELAAYLCNFLQALGRLIKGLLKASCHATPSPVEVSPNFVHKALEVWPAAASAAASSRKLPGLLATAVPRFAYTPLLLPAAATAAVLCRRQWALQA